MAHAVQDYNIQNGQFDYLTYCILKEDLISTYDEEFYEVNYRNFFNEIDSRIEAILGMNELCKEQCDQEESLEDWYMIERNMQQEERKKHIKKIFVSNNELYIDITKYLGMIIKKEPKIIEENKILQIEYTENGDKKSIAQMLEEFNDIDKLKEYHINWENLYLIYSGIMQERIDSGEEVTDEIMAKFEKFKKMNLVSKTAIKQWYDLSDIAKMGKAVSRFSATDFQKI